MDKYDVMEGYKEIVTVQEVVAVEAGRLVLDAINHLVSQVFQPKIIQDVAKLVQNSQTLN